MRNVIFLAVALLTLPALAAERAFDFGDYPIGQAPAGFSSLVAGRGKPGQWKVIWDSVPPLLAPLNPQAQSVAKRAVLAQLASTPIDNHYPMLIFDGGTYGDFKLTTRFKIVSGALAESAGVVFRFQNISNYFVVRASAWDGNFRCFKVVNGEMKPPIGPDMDIAKDVWHELSVQCEGTRILCSLDGKDAIKLIDIASAGTVGKVGFWTGSDTVSYFVDTKITYAVREILAQSLVGEVLKEYPRLLGLKIFAIRPGSTEPSLIASKDEKEVGQPGGKTEADVIRHGTSYFAKDNDTVSVTLPLRDRNGDPIAAVRVTMKSFPGQTEQNAVIRAQPIMRMMKGRALSLDDLFQ